MRIKDKVLCHAKHELTWTASGSATVTVGGVEFQADTRHAVWVPAGVLHTITPDEDALVLPVWFELTTLPGMSEQVCFVSRSATLDFLVRSVHQPVLYADTPRGHVMNKLRTQIAALAHHRDAAPGQRLPLPVDSRVRHIAMGIVKDLGCTFSLDEWARTEHISGKTLRRIFLKETGHSFAAWRTTARMQWAAARIEAGAMIGTIAHQCGYASISAFTTAFSRYHGVSPASYRALRR